MAGEERSALTAQQPAQHPTEAAAAIAAKRGGDLAQLALATEMREDLLERADRQSGLRRRLIGRVARLRRGAAERLQRHLHLLGGQPDARGQSVQPVPR